MQTPDIIKKFYQSKRWKDCRKVVIHKARGMCNDCGKAGWQVHHKIPLTENNLNDPDISINLKNLELLCDSCHNAKRSNGYIRNDLIFTDDGDVVLRCEKDSPPSVF